MIGIKIARVSICGKHSLWGGLTVEVNGSERGKYKSIIDKLSHENYGIITVAEYEKKFVKYALKKNIIVEDESYYLPEYFEKNFEKRFISNGPLNLGIIFEQHDARLVEKIVLKVSKYCKFLTLPNYPRCRRLAELVLNSNGLQINLENTLEKVIKKCDIILNMKNLEFI